MPIPPIVESLLDLLEPWGPVSTRRMFGCHGFFREGLMFGFLDGETFYLKVDDVSRERFEERGLEPIRFTDRHGRQLSMSYYPAPESALSSSLRMKPWAQLGWEAALRAAEKARAPKKRRSRKRPSST